MKLYYIILFITFFNTSYGQTYTFDKLVKNDFNGRGFPKRERSNLINSKNYSYRMKIYTQNDSLKSRIFDTKRNKIHFFSIDKKDSMRLDFLKTVSLKKDVKNFTYEFSHIKRQNNEIKLTIRNQKKRKIAKYKLTIKETDENLFSIFKLTNPLEIFHSADVELPFNFMVLKAKGINGSGNYVEYEFKSIEEINISVTIP